MKCFGVLTSGGDAPGMNAAIRAVVRACAFYEIDTVGIYNGYAGIIKGEFCDLSARSVANIIHRGGTILKSARSKKFMERIGREIAFQNLQKRFLCV